MYKILHNVQKSVILALIERGRCCHDQIIISSIKVVKVISERSIKKIRLWLTQNCKGKSEKVLISRGMDLLRVIGGRGFLGES